MSGLDRPAVQWLFVGLAVALIVLTALLSVALWRARAEVRSLRAASEQVRMDRERLEARLAREMAARESLALELARQKGAGNHRAAPPTLTLEPVRAPRATPPPATVDAPGAALAIELRLLLPSGAQLPAGPYTIALRDWSTGALFWTRGNVQPTRVDGHLALVTIIGGDLLRRGSYEVAVTASDAAGARADVAVYEVSVR